MSRAFIKEDAEDPDELPERPQSSSPNYVTTAGLESLRRKVLELKAAHASEGDDRRRRALARDLKYYEGRIARAILVASAGRPSDEIRFGAVVEAKDGAGAVLRFMIVGQDEAEEGGDKLSWDSPAALALLGAKPGDRVRLPLSEPPLEVTIVAIRY